MPTPSENAPNEFVIDAAGQRAAIVSTEHAEGEQRAWLRLDDGTQLLVPLSALARLDDGGWRLPFTFDAAREEVDDVQMSFPVMEERLQVGKRLVDTGRGLRIRKTVGERERVIDEPLMRDELAVEHVPVGQIVPGDAPPQMRYEGDTLVVPVLEEVLVVQKQLLLKEEVRITRHRHEVREPQRVALRSEHVEVERFEGHGEMREEASGEAHGSESGQAQSMPADERLGRGLPGT
ncbi:MAG TPA: YsnF/AvaK domain-containing protein [Noviherbaspirillum sp.]